MVLWRNLDQNHLGIRKGLAISLHDLGTDWKWDTALDANPEIVVLFWSNLDQNHPEIRKGLPNALHSLGADWRYKEE